MSNLRAREALERARRLFIERPTAARKTTLPVTAVLQDGLECLLSSSEGHTLVTDMSKALGGGDAGNSPGWLLRASLAACTATSIAMKAALQGIELRALEVTVHSDGDLRGAVGIDVASMAMSGMRMSIRIGADNAPEATLREIATWAATLSTVSATLQEGRALPFDVTLIQG